MIVAIVGAGVEAVVVVLDTGWLRSPYFCQPSACSCSCRQEQPSGVLEWCQSSHQAFINEISHLQHYYLFYDYYSTTTTATATTTTTTTILLHILSGPLLLLLILLLLLLQELLQLLVPTYLPNVVEYDMFIRRANPPTFTRQPPPMEKQMPARPQQSSSSSSSARLYQKPLLQQVHQQLGSSKSKHQV